MSQDIWRYYDELPIVLQQQIQLVWAVSKKEFPHEAYRYCVRDGQLVDRKRSHIGQRWQDGDWK